MGGWEFLETSLKKERLWRSRDDELYASLYMEEQSRI